MYELKTKLSNASVIEFIESLDNNKRKEDSLILMDIISRVSDEIPRMWGGSIVGYGAIKYTNSTKKEYDWFKFGFSPRKNALTLYLTAYSEYIYEVSESMGLKHGKGCVYIKDIKKLDANLLVQLIKYTFDEGDKHE